MKKLYQPLKLRVITAPHVDVLTASAESADAPFLKDIYGAEDWN